MLKFTFSKITIFILVVFVISNNVFAEMISFNQTDFLVSTVTTSSINLISNPSFAPVIPSDETFTLNPTTENLKLTFQQGKFLKFNFNLPYDYFNLDFTFSALVNDEFALYINDTVVAIQDDALVENFLSPLPGFYLSNSGTAVDTSSGKLDYLLINGMQSLFQTGVNELTLFGTDVIEYGSFGDISGLIRYNVTEPPTNPVPEPSTLLLVGIGLIGFAGIRRKYGN